MATITQPPPIDKHTQAVTGTSTSQTHPVPNGVIHNSPPPQQQPTPVVIPQSPITGPQLISNHPPPSSLQQHESASVSTPVNPFEPVTKEAVNIKKQFESKQAELKAKKDAQEAEHRARMEAIQKEEENCYKTMTASIINVQKQMRDADKKSFDSIQAPEDEYDYIKQRRIHYHRYKLAILTGADGKKEKQTLDEFDHCLETTIFDKNEYESKENQGIETSNTSQHEKQQTKRKGDDENITSPRKQPRSKPSRHKPSTKTSSSSTTTTRETKEASEQEQTSPPPTSSTNTDSTDSASATKPVNRQLSKEMTSPSKRTHHSDAETHEDKKEKQKSTKHKPSAAQHIMNITAQLATGVSGKDLPVRSKFHKDHNTFKIDMTMYPNLSIDDNIQSNLQRLTKRNVLIQGPRPALLVSRLKFRLFRDNHPHPVEEIKSFDDFVYNGDVDNNTTVVYLLSHDITTTDDQHKSATLFIYPTSPFQFAYINITDENGEKMKITSIHTHVQKIFAIKHNITYKQPDDTPVTATTKESVTRIINSKKHNRSSSTPESSPQPPSKKTKTDDDNDGDNSDEDKKVNIRLPNNIFKIFNDNLKQLNNTNINGRKENVVGYIFGKVREEQHDEKETIFFIDASHLQIDQSINSTITTTQQQADLVHVGNICAVHPPSRPFVISQCDNQAIKPFFFTFTLTKNDKGEVEYSMFSASNEIIQQYNENLSRIPKDFKLTEHFLDNDDDVRITFIEKIDVDVLLSSSQGTTTNTTTTTTPANI